MFVEEIINRDIAPLRTSDPASFAMGMMDEYRLNHLPIVNGVDYLGLISENDIFAESAFDEPVGSLKLSLNRPFIEEHRHIFEAVKLAAELKLTVIPVVNKKEQYLGVITLEKLVYAFSRMSAIENPGGLIVLEININDYSMSEISQIVESNDAKILSMFINPHSDSTKLDVTLKLNRNDLGSILQTFNRYNYIVKAIYAEEEYMDYLHERYDLLMKFLDI